MIIVIITGGYRFYDAVINDRYMAMKAHPLFCAEGCGILKNRGIYHEIWHMRVPNLAGHITTIKLK